MMKQFLVLDTLLFIISIKLFDCFIVTRSQAIKSGAGTSASTTSLKNWPWEKSEKTGIAIIDAVTSKNVNDIKDVLSTGKESDSTGDNAMHIIARKGHYNYPPSEIPKLLVDGGIDINAKDGKGQTALEISLLKGWQKISMLLLEAGADRSVVTQDVKSRITCPDCKRVVKQYSL